MNASETYYQQTFTAENRFPQEHSLGINEPDHFSQSYQQQLGQQQHLQNVQPQMTSLQSTFFEDSFDQVRDRHQFEFPQQSFPRPGTSGSVMTSGSRFVPHQQQFVPQQSSFRSQHFKPRPGTGSRFMNIPYQQEFVQPQQSSFQPTMYHEDSFHQGYSDGQQMIGQGGYTSVAQQRNSRAAGSVANPYRRFPDSINQGRPGTSQFSQLGRPQLNHFESNFHHDGTDQMSGQSSFQPPYHEGSFDQGYSRSDHDFPPRQFSQQQVPSNFNIAAQVGMSGSQGGYNMSGAQQERSRAAGSVVNNPYRRQTDANSSGPPMNEVVVEAMNDETTSQFEDAFF